MSSKNALDIAREAGLDLVLISPNAKPAVCRIMDYGKYKFEQSKKMKEARKKQKVVDMKVIQLSLNIGQHDIDYRSKQARSFFEDGAKVKVSILLKGRQQAYASRGIELENSFFESLSDICVVEREPKVEGRFILMILAPKQAK